MLLTRLLTQNLRRIPLLRIDFNMKKFKESGAPNSCIYVVHPSLAEDDHIRETLKGLCDYIREKYNMEKII